MSVGGTVVETIVLSDKVWVNTDEGRSYRAEDGTWVTVPSRECAVYVERTPASEYIEQGDSLWWQGNHAYWTPKSGSLKRNPAFTDKPLKRIGYSGVSRPAAPPSPSGTPTETRADG